MSSQLPLTDDIRELEAIRTQTKYWSVGSLLAIVIILAIGLSMVVSGVKGLTNPGPTQDEFSTDLASDLNQNVLPNVQTIAGQALTESQPAIEAQFLKLNDRVPDVSNTFMQQLQLLQRNLPEQGEKVLDATFSQTLAAEEPKIRQIVPTATDQNVADLVTNVTSETQNQIAQTTQTMFAPHEAELSAIVVDMDKIENSEPVDPDQDKVNLDMALSLVNTFHSDLVDMDNASTTATATTAKKGKSK